MSLDPVGAMFRGHSRLPLGSESRLLLLVAGLVNVMLTMDPLIISVVAGIGGLAMLVEHVARVRFIPPLAMMANLGLLVLVSKIFSLHLESFFTVLLRAVACTTLLSWFGGTVSWIQLKKRHIRGGRLSHLCQFIDYGILHGDTLIFRISLCFDAVFVRVGRRCRRPNIVAAALANGLVASLCRAEIMADAQALRLGSCAGLYRCSGYSPNRHLASSSEKCALSATDVTVLREGSEPILLGISFQLMAAEWLFLAGPSGSGKTTLLRAVCGLQRISTGRILVGDKDEVRWRVSRSEIGLVFQNPDDQFCASTPREDIIWGLIHRGIACDEANERADFMLTELGIAALADQPLSRLSFGEKKRVAFAGVLATRPKILLCDEPTSGLDPMASHSLINTLEKYAARDSISVIWVSHDLHLVPRRVNRVMLLRSGQVVSLDKPNEALTAANLQHAGLLPPDFL